MSGQYLRHFIAIFIAMVAGMAPFIIVTTFLGTYWKESQVFPIFLSGLAVGLLLPPVFFLVASNRVINWVFGEKSAAKFFSAYFTLALFPVLLMGLYFFT